MIIKNRKIYPFVLLINELLDKKSYMKIKPLVVLMKGQ